jgi:hypothetical protein
MAQDLPPSSFVARLWSGRIDEWELHHCDQPAGLCPLRTGSVMDESGPGTQRRCLDIRTADAAMEWLGVCVTHSDDMTTLRDVLRDDALTLSRMANHQVVERVATMVARRALCVVVAVPPVSPAFIEPVPKAPSRAARTPSQVRIEEPPPIEIDEFPNVPAAMLVDAARTGTPFCEH